MIFATLLLDKLLIDDPVGAIPVHLFCGIWGTFSVGLFSEGALLYPKYGIQDGPSLGILKGGGFEALWHQCIGIAAIGLFTVLFSVVAWGLVKMLLEDSLRVSREQELLGLDDAFDDKVSEKLAQRVKGQRGDKR